MYSTLRNHDHYKMHFEYILSRVLENRYNVLFFEPRDDKLRGLKRLKMHLALSLENTLMNHNYRAGSKRACVYDAR